MEHWNLPREFDVEDVIDPSPDGVINAGLIDLEQTRQIDIQEVAVPAREKERQAQIDSMIRLIEARTKQNSTYIVLASLILLIGCGFAAFLLRGDSSFLSFVLGLVEGLVGGVIGNNFVRREKRE